MDATARRLRAQLAINTRYARMSDHERKESTAAARRAANDRFEREVDPDGVLSVAERQRRAAYARRAHMQRMALASAKARKRRGAA
jgi:hypothetical protein